MHNVYVGRQPIFDRNLNLAGYELLFRGAQEGAFDLLDAEEATSQVIVNAFSTIGLDDLVGRQPAFVNVSERFVLMHPELPLPADRVVLELLEDTTPGEALLTALQEFRKRGFRIALDDFVYAPGVEPLLALADIVKVEIPRLSDAERAEHARLIKRYGAKPLAEKIEDQETFERCRHAGYELFQGFFLSRPATVQAGDMPAARLPLLRLLAVLQDDDADMDELSGLISRDAMLSYRLLRFLNSPATPLRRRIGTIREAVLYMGLRELRTWISLLALAAVPNKPEELAVTLIIRARFCELLCRRLGVSEPGACFMAGLLSGLDAVLDMPIGQILDRLPISAEVRSAIVDKTGDAGAVLKAAKAYEEGRFDEVRRLPLEPASVTECYGTAVKWVEEIRANW
ncbi:MAG: HDOD domain-containing protein [Ectothiorhodospiraceae bacterium]|jgi:EAL and modified HD-GYP domain-containing signal transduction protein